MKSRVHAFFFALCVEKSALEFSNAFVVVFLHSHTPFSNRSKPLRLRRFRIVRNRSDYAVFESFETVPIPLFFTVLFSKFLCPIILFLFNGRAQEKHSLLSLNFTPTTGRRKHGVVPTREFRVFFRMEGPRGCDNRPPRLLLVERSETPYHTKDCGIRDFSKE